LAQKNEKAEDLRVRRTRKALQTALIELSVEKGFAEVTVRDITERAIVNRATFYRHYQDKYDLLKQYMEEIYQMLNSFADTTLNEKQANTGSQPPEGMVQMLRKVEQHADFFRLMLGPNGDPQFVQQIREYIKKRMRQLLPDKPLFPSPENAPLDLTLEYVASAGVGALYWWLEKGTSYSPEQLAAWIVQYSNADFGLSINPPAV
jgi:AcrR family transcriptional regulator